MRLDLIQAKQFAVLFDYFLNNPKEGGETKELLALELGLPVEDYNPAIHWPRLCTRRALTALRAVEHEIAQTNDERRV